MHHIITHNLKFSGFVFQPHVKPSISHFIAFAHTSVNEVSVKYQENEKHYNYTTPKSFLELIKLYQNLLEKKRKEQVHKMKRLENGLQKLQTTASQVHFGIFS